MTLRSRPIRSSPADIARAGAFGISRSVLRALPDAAVFVFDRELRFVFADGDGLLSAGLSPQAVEGRPMVDVLDAPAFEQLRAAYTRALAGETSQLDIWVGDQPRVHRVRVAPVRGERGEVVAGMVLSVDVTAERRVEGQLRDLDDLRRRAMESSPIGMSLTDPEGRYAYVNPALAELLGRDAGELVGVRFFDVVHAGDRGRDVAAWKAMCAGERDQYQVEKRYLRPDGSGVHALVSVSVLRGADGRPAQFFSQVVDLTERRRSEQEARRRAAQQSIVAVLGARALDGLELSLLLDEAAAAVAQTLDVEFVSVLEVRPGKQEAMVHACVGFDGTLDDRSVIPIVSGGRIEHALNAKRPLVTEDLAVSGLRAPTLERHGIVSTLSAVIGERDRPFGLISVHTATPRTFSAEDGDFLSAIANLLWSAIDRTESEQLIRHQALHDALTGLPNRVLVLDRLDLALKRAQRTHSHVAVLVLDVDNFKLINDSLGHHAGDELLTALAPRLRTAVRPGDTIARLGGDEFVVLCEDIADAGAAESVADRVGASTREPFTLANAQHFVGVSVGVALSAPGATAESLLRDADAALYRAKERGRGRVEIFEDTMRARTVARLNTEGDLRRALERDELRVYYQPYFELASERLVGMEALVRWQHPERGLVPPIEFIPIAEESDLIVALGEWVLCQAVRQLAAWRQALAYDAERELGVSVNVSARQLLQPGLPVVVADVLRSTGLPAQALALELTETVLIDPGVQPEYVLAALKATGVMVVLDDFGTGYSSLSHLQRFPIDVLKIDRSFVDSLDSPDRTSDPIVRAIMGMAKSLGIRTIAEGVEREAQVDALRELGAEAAQGFLFARPLPAEAMWRLLEEQLADGASELAAPGIRVPRRASA